MIKKKIEGALAPTRHKEDLPRGSILVIAQSIYLLLLKQLPSGTPSGDLVFGQMLLFLRPIQNTGFHYY